MSNSFYYFFSATPQVLAAILALFGVFVIFKIQNIKKTLFGVGQSIYDKWYALIIDIQYSYLKLWSESITTTLKIIKEALNENNLDALDTGILMIDTALYVYRKLNQPKGNNDREATKQWNLTVELFEDLEFWSNRFKRNFEFLQKLINQTIFWSISTAAIIIISLTILSQGNYFLSHRVLLLATFWVIIALIIGCFSGLVYILIKSLKES